MWTISSKERMSSGLIPAFLNRQAVYTVPTGKVIHDPAYPLAALKDLDLPIKKEKKEALKARIESQFSDGKQVWIGIRAVTESSSKIKVRVGTFGDRSKSEKILEAIHQHL